jgi:hypothetical protein
VTHARQEQEADAVRQVLEGHEEEAVEKRQLEHARDGNVDGLVHAQRVAEVHGLSHVVQTSSAASKSAAASTPAAASKSAAAAAATTTEEGIVDASAEVDAAVAVSVIASASSTSI